MMRYIFLFIILCVLASTCLAERVTVRATPFKGGTQTQVIDTSLGYWVYCPGGNCPVPGAPQQPQAPPEFEFPDDEKEPQAPPDDGEFELPEQPETDSRLTIILSAIAAVGGIASGYFASRETEDVKDEETSEPNVEPVS